MKSDKPSTRTSKRSQRDASTTFGAMPIVEEAFVDLTTAVDLATGASAEDVNPTVALPLSLCAVMQSFMTTQVAYGQLLDELLTEVSFFRVDFVEYRSDFPSPPPFED